jgi:Tol biopolymer transport system component
MPVPHRFPRLTFELTIAAAALSCSGGGGLTVPPTTGNLEITTSTSGTEQDADGYSVQIDAGPALGIGAAATLTAPEVTPGNHTVQLGELAANCTVSGDNPQTVSVTAGETATVGFAVTCSATATTGTIQVSVATSGSPTDPDGYVAKLDGGDPGLSIAVGGNVSFTSVPAGSHTIDLTGVAANCSVTGGPSRNITVTVGATAELSLVVTCAAATGSIQVRTATTGSPVDPDGYTVSIDGGAPQAIGPNATLTLEGLGIGAHALTLSGVAGNCHLDGENQRTVEVSPGSTAVAFDLNCLGANALIAFASNAFELLAIFTVNPDGTGLRRLTPDGAAESNPTWSPHGNRILFSKRKDLYVMNADGRGRVKLADGHEGIFEHRWSPDSRMIAYVDTRREGTDLIDELWVMQADGAAKVKVAERALNFSWSWDNRIVYTSFADLGDVHLRIINAEGSGDVRLTSRAAFQPAWSPDGTRIAFVTLGENDVFLINPDGSGEVNLTQGLSDDDGPTWSPDGSRIAFTASPLGQPMESEVAVMNRDGSGRTNLTDRPGFDYQPAWSPDGTKIVFTRAENAGDSEIYVMNADGSNPTNVSNRPGTRETTPDWNGQGPVTAANRQSAFYNAWLRANQREPSRLDR